MLVRGFVLWLVNQVNLLQIKFYFACSLPLFNGLAIERINELYSHGKIEKVIGTDVVNLDPNFEKENPWYVSVVLADYFAKVIFNLHTSQSISKLLTEYLH